MALKAWDDGREGEELWHSWSAGASNYNHRRANESWRSFEPDGKVTPASLQYEAQQAGWQRAQPTSTVYGAPPANAPVRRAAGAAPKVLDGPPAAWADEEAARAALDLLPRAAESEEAIAYLAKDYGLSAFAIPDDWRIYEHGQLGPGIAYPGYSPGGELSVKYKSFNRTLKNGKLKRDSRFLFKGGEHPAIWLAQEEAHDDPIAIVGGEEKAVGLYTYGGVNVLSSLTGEGSSLADEWKARIVARDPPRIILCNDNDPAGREGNRKLAEELTKAGVKRHTIYTMKWADGSKAGYDINDALRDGVDLFELLRQAEPVYPSMSMFVLRDFEGLELEDKDQVLGDHLFELGGIGLIVGPGAIGKSRLVLQLAFSQVLGRDWCGLETHGAPLKWAFFQNENGTSRAQSDFIAMARELSMEQREMLNRHVFYNAMRTDYDYDICLASEEVQNKLRAEIARLMPDVVVIDPWGNAFAGDSENDAAQTNTSLRHLRNVVRPIVPHALIIIVHHSRSGRDGLSKATGIEAGSYVRGSKALTNAARGQVNIVAGSDDMPPSHLVMICGKCNNGPYFKSRAVKLDETSKSYYVDPHFNWDDFEEFASGKGRKQAGRPRSLSINQIVAALPDDGSWVKQMDVVAAFEAQASKSAIYNVIQEAVKAGQILSQSVNHTNFLRRAPHQSGEGTSDE